MNTALLTPRSLPATDLEVFEGMLFGRVVEGNNQWLCAWSLPALREQWRILIDYRPTLCARGAVRVVRAGPRDYEHYDPQTGALLRRVAVGEWDIAGRLFCDNGEIFHGAEGAIAVRALDDAALLRSAPAGSEWCAVVALTPETVVLRLEGEDVHALDRSTLQLRWTLEGVDILAMTASRESLFASVMPHEDMAAPRLLAIDAATGETRWSELTRCAPRANNGDVLLTADDVGWVIARDASTGETRWQQWLGAPVRTAVSHNDGFVALTHESLVALDADGVERARWSARSERDACLRVWNDLLLCGSITGIEARPTESLAPRKASATLRQHPRTPWVWPEGTAFRAPRRAHLDALREVLQSIDNLDEAWEALATRGLIPASWVHNDARRFYSSADGWVLRPVERGAMLAFASDIDGVTRCEALMREARARLGAWGAPHDGTLRWELSGANTRVLSPAPEFAGDAPLRALYATLGAEAVNAHRIALDAAREITFLWNESTTHRVILGDMLWRTAALHDVAVHVPETHSLRGRRFDELPNPFEPLVEIVATGYLFDAECTLLAYRFNEDLQQCPEGFDDDDIPF